MADAFTLEFLQAVSDWQRGPSAKKKIERGEALKRLAAPLPHHFRSCGDPCYRQEAHDKGRTWQLLLENQLPVTVAAWTTSLGIAEQFKGGVPPEGLQGVILRVEPPENSVVLNLKALYADTGFRAALEANRSKIDYYESGAGKYAATQDEVVLDSSHLTGAQIFSYGGYAGSFEHLMCEFGAMYRREPTVAETKLLENSARKPWWLSEDGTRNVIGRLYPKFRDRIFKRLHELGLNSGS